MDDHRPTPRLAIVLAGFVLVASPPAPAPGAGRTAPRTPSGAGTSAACPPGGEQRRVPVLVARSVIVAGTLGSAILRKRLYELVRIPCVQRAEGAIGAPKLLEGRVAIVDVFPGQQLLRADFSGVLRVSFTATVRPGGEARLTVGVTPPARCTIRVGSLAASPARGLGPRRGTRVSWRWRVASDARPGRRPVVVRCGASGSLTLRMRVAGG